MKAKIILYINYTSNFESNLRIKEYKSKRIKEYIKLTVYELTNISFRQYNNNNG
jgi:hypothetical protein